VSVLGGYVSESKVRVEARPWVVAFLDPTDRFDYRGAQSFTRPDGEVAEARDPCRERLEFGKK
jgi:hypothetical protein